MLYTNFISVKLMYLPCIRWKYSRFVLYCIVYTVLYIVLYYINRLLHGLHFDMGFINEWHMPYHERVSAANE